MQGWEGIMPFEDLRQGRLDIVTRLAPPDEREQITFMLYEEIAAFKRAAEAKGFTRQEVEDVFHRNAHKLLGAAN
jgi:hypothetical protein